MTAAGRGFMKDVDILLQLGANLHLKARDGRTALDWARTWERSEICNLLESHLSVRSRDVIFCLRLIISCLRIIMQGSFGERRLADDRRGAEA